MRKLIGPHLAGTWPNKLDIVAKWQPRLITVLQPEIDKVKQLRGAIPGAIIIGRFFHDDSHYASNIAARPKDFAREIHNEIASNPVTPFLDYAQSNNETNQDWQGIQKLNEYTEEWMFLADQSQLYKCAILAFSVGNPDLPNKPGDPAGFNGKMLYWQQVLPSLNYAQVNNHILLMHAYGYPNMFAPDADWYIYRYERQVAVNLRTLGITKLKYAYGEIGIDRLIVDGRGGYKVVPTTDEGYVNQTLQWERDLQGEDLLLGGTIFTFGDSGGWGTYDIADTNVASMIAQHYVDHAADYDGASNGGDTVFIPTVGTGEEPMPPPNPTGDIFWDERLTKRGIELHPYKAAPGEGYWKIVRGEYWEEKEHTFAVTLKDGKRHPGVMMRWWWADGEEKKRTELKPGDRWMVDFAMFAHSKSYGLTALDGPSDYVWGMGLGSWQQPDWNIHVSYHFTFQWVVAIAQPAPAPAPIPAPTPTSPPSPTSGSALVVPAQGVTTQRWGENPEDYVQFGIPGHNGWDIANRLGTRIDAVADGKVSYTGTDKDYGNYIRIFHPHLKIHSFYAHLQDIQVKIGDLVKQGQQIATMGSTGNATGSHLHLEFRASDIEGNYIDLSGGHGKGRFDPQIAYHLLNQPRAAAKSTSIKTIVADAAREFGLDAAMFDRLVHAESKHDPNAQSKKGAVGLTQIMPDTWGEFAPKVGATNIRDPRDNARVGARYIRYLLDYYKGDLRKALTAYNWGMGRVDSGKNPPPETVAYVNEIVGGV